MATRKTESIWIVLLIMKSQSGRMRKYLLQLYVDSAILEATLRKKCLLDDSRNRLERQLYF